MATEFRSPIVVHLKFASLKGVRGDFCTNPVHGGHFVWGFDRISIQKREALQALRAREWFAVNGPPDAPPLPISHGEIEEYRMARGLKGVVGFYARSVMSLDYDMNKHPSFEDYARGLMASHTGLWQIEKDLYLQHRFPPCGLIGMDNGLQWEPPKRTSSRRAA